MICEDFKNGNKLDGALNKISKRGMVIAAATAAILIFVASAVLWRIFDRKLMIFLIQGFVMQMLPIQIGGLGGLIMQSGSSGGQTSGGKDKQTVGLSLAE